MLVTLSSTESRLRATEFTHAWRWGSRSICDYHLHNHSDAWIRGLDEDHAPALLSRIRRMRSY